MNLDEYLSLPPGVGLSAEQLKDAIGLSHSAQIRQWRIGARDFHRKGARLPSPTNAVAIERATGGKVRVWDLRPNDWHSIWEHLIGTPGAPPVPATAKAA